MTCTYHLIHLNIKTDSWAKIESLLFCCLYDQHVLIVVVYRPDGREYGGMLNKGQWVIIVIVFVVVAAALGPEEMCLCFHCEEGVFHPGISFA